MIKVPIMQFINETKSKPAQIIHLIIFQLYKGHNGVYIEKKFPKGMKYDSYQIGKPKKEINKSTR